MPDYHRLPLIEYARGAVEVVLARGVASHAILYSTRQYAHGGLYLAYGEVRLDDPNPEDTIKYLSEHTSHKGQVLKVINLQEEDYEEVLADIDTVYKKVVGKEFDPNGSVGY